MKLKSDLSILSIIIDRIGQHKVLLLININYYNFQKKKIHLRQTAVVEKMLKVENFHFFFCKSKICR